MRRYLIVLAVLCTAAWQTAYAQEAPPQNKLQWYKGNTHTHTKNSDGDTSPELVARWYRDNQYDFLVLSDHNKLTPVETLQAEINEENAKHAKKAKPFLLIPGEEVSDGFDKHPVHLGAIGTTKVVGKQGGASIVEVLQRCVDATHAAGGLVHINHPNFGWALSAEDLLAVKNVHHFEVYNGHPGVNNTGGGGAPSTEEMWDKLLSQQRLYYAVATDDMHNMQSFDRRRANPGRGWVVVRAAQLTPKAIIDALASGDFYASTGVELDELTTGADTLSLKIKRQGDRRFRTHFVGINGKILKEDTSMEPFCQLKAGEPYVRARVTSSAGDHAWTQPLFAAPPKP